MILNYILLPDTDAEWNLAAEQYVFDALPRDRSYFMLWQNRNAVIVGKYQNTLAEINADYVREKQIQVVRRLSGGGAVYHDLGNLNYTLISDAEGLGKLDLSFFCLPVLRALRALGLHAELNGRNDLTVDGKKISGSSQYIRQGRVMHHGTLLFDSDLDAVSRALHADAEKLESKGVASVRSRVGNIRPLLPKDLSLDAFRRLLLAQILAETPGEEYRFRPADLRAIEEIKNQRYARWEWNYGRSPSGSAEKKRRIEGCGTVSVFLTTDAGRIRSLSFRGDYFSTLEPELLAEKLVGIRLCEEDLNCALSDLDPGLYLHGMTREALIRLLLY